MSCREQRRKNMRLYAWSAILGLLLSVVPASLALAADAEYIWAENDYPGSTLYMSTYQNGAWGDREVIFSDEHLNILPSLGSDSQGNHLAVWVTLMPQGSSVLRYSWQQNDGWTEPEILWDGFKENLAPVVLFDAADTAWVFWSANDGDDDDIYQASFVDGNWNPPRQVNRENDVPDILPSAILDQNGNVVVHWQQLQPDATYQERSKVVATVARAGLLAKNKKFRKTRKSSGPAPARIPAPPFEGNSRTTIHYPDDIFNQFTTIKKRADR